MFLKPPNFILCRYENGIIIPEAELDNYASAKWGKIFAEFYAFEIIVPLTKTHLSLLTKGKIIHDKQYEISAIIEIINYRKNDDGSQEIIVKGRTLECLLTYRAIVDTEIFKNKHVSTIMYEMTDKHIINPEIEERKILGFANVSDDESGPIITTQKTGGNLYEFFNALSVNYNFGFDVFLDLSQGTLDFKANNFIDKTIGQTTTAPVVFSNDTEDILSDEFYVNNQNYCTMAYVAGESGEGQREMVIINKDSESVGIERRELYVDARDLQKEPETSSQEYQEILRQRGLTRLSENDIVQNFTGKINSRTMTYGIDYNVGDKVTTTDTDFGIIFDSLITKFELIITPQSGVESSIVLGNQMPNIFKRIKQK